MYEGIMGSVNMRVVVSDCEHALACARLSAADFVRTLAGDGMTVSCNHKLTTGKDRGVGPFRTRQDTHKTAIPCASPATAIESISNCASLPRNDNGRILRELWSHRHVSC